MDITLEDNASYTTIVDALRRCGVEDAVCCGTEILFNSAKHALVQEKLSGVTLQLLDADGYAIRQVTSRRRSDQAPVPDRLNDRQLTVIKALEKVLRHCQKEGIQLVGYSDELVALPAQIKPEAIASACALDIETYGAYRGAEALTPDAGTLLSDVLP
ncbi:response regulator [Marinobacterium sedimentorum]|uniref:response regulator n=1 Tax=Marinobacterium sedimentorum TaxID=2927804 RepID=UPI0020C6FA85|nr:response regulator [Marinobacterium sedimentorum]MCP8689309.1 response regulator [Marinobacterium sedimentorum]